MSNKARCLFNNVLHKICYITPSDNWSLPTIYNFLEMTTTKNVSGIKPSFSKIPSQQLPSQSVIPRLAASVSPALLEIQILKPPHQNHKLWGLAQQSVF